MQLCENIFFFFFWRTIIIIIVLHLLNIVDELEFFLSVNIRLTFVKARPGSKVTCEIFTSMIKYFNRHGSIYIICFPIRVIFDY